MTNFTTELFLLFVKQTHIKNSFCMGTKRSKYKIFLVKFVSIFFTCFSRKVKQFCIQKYKMVGMMIMTVNGIAGSLLRERGVCHYFGIYYCCFGICWLIGMQGLMFRYCFSVLLVGLWSLLNGHLKRKLIVVSLDV